MKIYSVFSFVALFMLFLSSCEEVIEVDLNDADPKLVIEARLDAGTSLLDVTLTRSQSFFNNDDAQAVLDANVELVHNGNTVQIGHAGNGFYREFIPVQQGDNLQLRVLDGAELHTASVVVPRQIPLDSLSTEYFEPNSFFDGGSIVYLYFQEPGNEPNYYRVLVSRNGNPLDGAEDIIVENDLLSDGQFVQYPLFGNFYEAFDEIEIVLQSVTESTFDYYTTLQDITINQGGGSTAAPANPISNIEGGALGLFDVHYADTMSIVVPEP